MICANGVSVSGTVFCGSCCQGSSQCPHPSVTTRLSRLRNQRSQNPGRSGLSAASPSVSGRSTSELGCLSARATLLPKEEGDERTEGKGKWGRAMPVTTIATAAVCTSAALRMEHLPGNSVIETSSDRTDRGDILSSGPSIGYSDMAREGLYLSSCRSFFVEITHALAASAPRLPAPGAWVPVAAASTVQPDAVRSRGGGRC